MARTRYDHPPQVEATAIAQATTVAEPSHAAEERRTVLLEPEQEGNAKALLQTLIAIARRIASEQQTVVESNEAGELAA